MLMIMDSFGQSTTSWISEHGIKVVLIIVASVILNIILKRIFIKTIRISVTSDRNSSPEAEKKREDTLIRIMAGTLRLLIIITALMLTLQEIGIAVGPVIAGAGIVGLALGFGGQYLIRDLISGLFIIIENQYRIGDVINIDSTGGLVEDISLRKTTLRDLDGTVHHIPHGEIKKVSNLSKQFARINLDIGISYNSDIDNVIQVVNKTGADLASDPLFKDSITDTPKFLRIEKFGDSAIIIKILGETRPLKQWEVTGELRKRLKKAFDLAGIEIPYPQIVVHT